MNIVRITSIIARIGIGVAIIFTLSGCSKFPSTPATTGRQLVITLTVRGEVDVDSLTNLGYSRHYFIAIDNDGDPNTGPLAALYPPYGGTGWVTSEDAENSVGLTSFLEYDSENPEGYIYGVEPGSYFLNLTSPDPPITSEILNDGRSIRFTIDFSQIATDNIPADSIDELDINFIATNALPTGGSEYITGREIDGLGSAGQDYITISTATDTTYTDDDTDSSIISDPDLDIVSWQIEVETVSTY
ncbi:MAG: hypothetical protein ABFD49_04060 [Armatimonadota bacterium]|nr:hypothetical protein [bacterium]